MNQKTIKNGRVFKIKYFGVTKTSGSRIKIIDCRFKISKMIPRSYEHINGIYDALDYLNKIGIKIKYQGELSDNENILITDNFDIPLRKG